MNCFIERFFGVLFLCVLGNHGIKAQDFIVTKTNDTLKVKVLGQNDSLIFFRRNAPGSTNEKLAKSEVKDVLQLRLNPASNVWPSRAKDNFFPVYVSVFSGYTHHLRPASEFVSTPLEAASAVNLGLEVSTLASEKLSVGLLLFYSNRVQRGDVATPFSEYSLKAKRKFTWVAAQLGINLSPLSPMRHKMLLQFGYSWMDVNANSGKSYSYADGKGITAGMGYEFSILYRENFQLYLRPNALITIRNKGWKSSGYSGYYGWQGEIHQKLRRESQVSLSLGLRI